MATSAHDVVTSLGFQPELVQLQQDIQSWVEESDPEMRRMLEWQFGSSSKYFRPLTIFSCFQALYEGPIPPRFIRSAVALELFHNVSLIIDDILDESSQRRGKPTLYVKFGSLQALMASGYITADGYRMVADDPHDIGLLSELLKRLGSAECMQWRLRRSPLGVEDWRMIAGEDTGSMFEVCACLGTRSSELRHFGRLLGMLYHGCDDVADAKGLQALGGGGDEDVRDGILTLPAALAIRDPQIRALFCKDEPTHSDLDQIARAITRQLDEGEEYLDELATEAREEALTCAPNPDPLLALVHHTRQLSSW
jgi:geranylgeranyl pyrophosphate synthase